MNLLNETLRIWAMHREFRSVLGELTHYSDRELSELGGMGVDRAHEHLQIKRG